MCVDDKIAEHVAKAFHDTLLLFDRKKGNLNNEVIYFIGR